MGIWKHTPKDGHIKVRRLFGRAIYHTSWYIFSFLRRFFYIHTCARFLYGYLGVEELERGAVWIGLNQAD